MTRRFWTLLATTGAIALSSLIMGKEPAQSQTASAFYCGMAANGLPATIYRNRDGRTEPWIVWRSDFFSDAGYNPEERCRQVSARLESYRSNRQLTFITVGTMNGENVICTASRINGRCENLIFTLKPGQDAIRTLNTFLAWREGQAGAPSLFESSGTNNRYIDVRERLGEDSGGTPAAVPVTPVAPVNTQPVIPQPSQNPGSLREL